MCAAALSKVAVAKPTNAPVKTNMAATKSYVAGTKTCDAGRKIIEYYVKTNNAGAKNNK